MHRIKYWEEEWKILRIYDLLAIRQKGESQNGCCKEKNKAHQIFRKDNIFQPLIRTRTSAYQGLRNVRFPENVACFIFF